jgi:hypothetical protein
MPTHCCAAPRASPWCAIDGSRRASARVASRLCRWDLMLLRAGVPPANPATSARLFAPWFGCVPRPRAAQPQICAVSTRTACVDIAGVGRRKPTLRQWSKARSESRVGTAMEQTGTYAGSVARISANAIRMLSGASSSGGRSRRFESSLPDQHFSAEFRALRS